MRFPRFAVLIIVALAVAVVGATAARGGAVAPLDPSTAWAPLPGPTSPDAQPDTYCSPTTCGGGGGSCTGSGYAGYFYGSLVASGQSASAKVSDIYHSLPSSGHVAAYVGVGNAYVYPNSQSAYIQAGLVDSGGGLLAFVQWDVNGVVSTAIWAYASSGTNYSATVTRVSSDTWKASIDGLSHQINVPMTHTDWAGEGDVVSSSDKCEVIDFQFSSMSPWTTSTMNPPGEVGPYFVTNVTATGFEAAGGT